MKKQMTSIMMAAVLAATVAVPSASALQAASVAPKAPSVSLPYVDDVNEWGSGRYILTVLASGTSAKLKATSKGKALKVKRHKRNVWTVVVKKRAYVKLTVSANGERKSIGFRVY